MRSLRSASVLSLAAALAVTLPAATLAQSRPTWGSPQFQTQQPPAGSPQPAPASPERPVWQDPAPQPAPQPASQPAPAADPVPSVPPATAPAEPPVAAAVPAGTPGIAISGLTDQDAQSAALLAMDRSAADVIFDQGPLIGYAAIISQDGQLYDSNGASLAGQAGVEGRFSTFPAALKLERRPERALAAGPVGTSWGTFAVKRGDQVMTEGYYLATWRLEGEAWKLVAELAAGRPPVAAALPARPAGPVPPGVPAAGAGQSAPRSGSTGTVMRDALGRPVQPAAGQPAAGTPLPGN